MSLPLHRLALPDPRAAAFAIGTFDTIGPLSRAEFPHRHSFYEVVFVTAGTGTHLLDLTPYRLAPPHLAVVLPGRMHQWQDVSGLDGWVILIGEDFLADRPGDRDLLHELGRRPWLTLRPADAADVAAVAVELHREYAQPSAGSAGVLKAYLHILLARARRLAGTAGPVAAADRLAAVTARFSRLVAQLGHPPLPVRDYAARLGVSPGYLREAVREVAGQSPGQLIRRAQVIEAKRLLGGTPLSVAQVSRDLGFADPAYFCRFFRRETGSTPGAFRRGAPVPTPAGRTPATPGPQRAPGEPPAREDTAQETPAHENTMAASPRPSKRSD